MRGLVAVALSTLALFGCGEKKERSDDIGVQTGRIASDTRVLGDAQAAVNEVVRNGADCEAARPAIPEANRKIDEAAGRVQTAAGRATLDAMRVQVKRVAEICP